MIEDITATMLARELMPALQVLGQIWLTVVVLLVGVRLAMFRGAGR